MQRLFAIIWLTWKAAFRYRLFWVLLFLLLVAVIGLPILIKDDGTARGFTQILLTYTLSAITLFLGFSTLWLACGTLARDIEECQIQMVAVKPIARWQIWIGKWLGILSLNAALLAVSGACVFFLLQWRAQQLPEDQQAILRNEILVARASLKEPAPDVAPMIDALIMERRRETGLTRADEGFLRHQYENELKAEFELVPPGYVRQWRLDTGLTKRQLRDQPLYLRIKFQVAREIGETYLGLWQIGVPGSARLHNEAMSLAPDTFHEFPIPPNLFGEDGALTIQFINQNNTALLFALDEGMEVLYREGSFGLNFARGMAIIFCWLAVLAALGLAAASFLSFPVAAFVSLSALIVIFSSDTLSHVVEEGTVFGINHESGAGGRPIDVVIVPAFAALLKLVHLVQGFSPVDALSTGRSIPWGQVGLAFGQIVLLTGGVLCAFGIFLFNRRELATAQSNQ